MATNEILPFAGTDTGTNLLTQAEYLADAQRPIGNQPGIARSKLANKALKQASVIAAGVAQFIADKQSGNITDALTPAAIASFMNDAVAGMLANTPASNISGGLGGSVPYQSAANTTAMLANGAAGQLLQANGTTLPPTWVDAPASNFGNKIINGSFDVWQLGASHTITAPLQKTADRWNYDRNGTYGTLVISRYTLPLGTFPFKYGARLNMSVAPTGNSYQDFSTQLEGVHVFAGSTVTISFYATSLTTVKPITLKTEQYFGGGGSPSASVFNTSAQININNTGWERYSATFNVASIAGKALGSNEDDTFNVIFSLPINQTFDLLIAGVKIERGTIASPFEYAGPGAVFTACQRYIQSSYSDGVPIGTVTSEGSHAFTAASTQPVYTVQLRTPMRTLPAVSWCNPATGAVGSWNNNGTPVTATTNTIGRNNVSVAFSGVSVGTPISGHVVLQDPYY